jgi:hypothetical protein
MSKVNAFLSERLKNSPEKQSKMSDLAEQSSQGNLSSFAGVFKVSALSIKEKELLQILLQDYKTELCDIKRDFTYLSSLTSEVKAINNQAAILHGERIKKAQTILKNYKEGAFTLWLIQTYGNRQTPYNFLQYYELYEKLSPTLIPKLDAMPRQAAYTLASRLGPFPLKEEVIQSYQGETKQILLDKIRKLFPLSRKDRRAQNKELLVIKELQKVADFLTKNALSFNPTQQKKAKELLKTLQAHIVKKEAL